jgi:hypothetical protein
MTLKNTDIWNEKYKPKKTAKGTSSSADWVKVNN